MSDKRIQLECLRRLHFLLSQGHDLQSAFELTLNDYNNIRQMQVAEQTLTEEIIGMFADTFVQLTEAYEDGSESDWDLEDCWSHWLKFSKITPEMSSVISETINHAAAAASLLDEEDDYSADEDGRPRLAKAIPDGEDGDYFIFAQFEKLSDSERERRVRNFLRVLASHHAGRGCFADISPFLKGLPDDDDGDEPRPFKIDSLRGVKTMDREANRFGHSTNPKTRCNESHQLAATDLEEGLLQEPEHTSAQMRSYLNAAKKLHSPLSLSQNIEPQGPAQILTETMKRQAQRQKLFVDGPLTDSEVRANMKTPPVVRVKNLLLSIRFVDLWPPITKICRVPNRCPTIATSA